MSWSRRTLLLSVAALAGCGFSPVLAPGGDAAGLRGEIEFDTPESFEGYALTRQLEERLGLPTAARYTLRARITQGSQVTGIPSDRVEARVNIVGQVDYTLTDNSSRKVVQRGRVHNFTGYSSTSTTAATRAARVDAEKRLMIILADQVVADLLATASKWRG